MSTLWVRRVTVVTLRGRERAAAGMQGDPLSLVRPRLLSKGVAEVIPLENAGAWTSASALAQQARAIRSHSLVLVWVLFIGKDE